MMLPSEGLENTGVASNPSEELPFSGPGILDYLLMLGNRKKLIFVVTVGAVLISTIYALVTPKVYTAKAMILPSDDDKGAVGAMMAQLGGLAGVAGGLGGPTKVDLYVTMLKSETVKDPIIERFKLMEVYGTKLRLDARYALDNNSSIASGRKDGVISISVDDHNPKRAADLANAYVEELGKLAANLNMAGASKNRAFLEERLAAAKSDLTRAEDALKSFQSTHKAVSVSDQAKASIEAVANLRGQLAAQEVQLGTLQRQYTNSSQEVKDAKAAVSSIRSQIARLEGSGGNSSIPSVSSVPQLGQEYVRLMREFKIHETVVELLTKQYEMTKINEVKDVSPFQVIQKASVPERKSKPAVKKIIALGMFAGFSLSILLALLLEIPRKMTDLELNKWRQVKSSLGFKRS